MSDTRKKLWITAFAGLWSTLTTLVLTWGSVFDWPDFYHVRYGLPFEWGRHTLSTIAGPVDIWQVNVALLCIDLVFWLGLMVLGVFILTTRRLAS